MIIALTGEKLAGKGTTADYLQRQYGARVLRFSQALSDILARLHQPNTRAELVALGSYVRSRFGDDILAKVVVGDALTATEPLVVIDGMRYLVERAACQVLPNFYLLNVTAPVEVRFERTRLRSEKADETTMSYSEFVQREQDATEQQIAAVQQQANQTIQNTGSLPDLYAALDQWLATLPH
ncbi:MAG: hypothetical protein HY565_00715 [Candidatus Kerfeldbacteria bacterium]|nr:hypothetical protein [Candidatus Kerfeldbacteria bacterium]